MITQYTSALIPDSVVDDKFPKADEDKLAGLGAQWLAVDAEMTSESGLLTAQSRTVFVNWSGSGADAADAQILAVTRFASSVATATATIGRGCQTAASYVANTKTGINVLLVHLDNLTKEQILLGLANPFMVPSCLETILELRARTRTIVRAYNEALTAAMACIPFSVTIQPRPHSTSAATGGTTAGSTTGSATSASVVAGGSGPAASAAPDSAGAPGAAAPAGWTGGLADVAVTDGAVAAVAGAISKATKPADAPTDPVDPTKAAQDANAAVPATGNSASKSTADNSTPTPAGLTPATAPTGNPADLLPDKAKLLTDLGQPTPAGTNAATSGAGAPTQALDSLPAGAKITDAVTNSVVGTGSAHDVARSLDHPSSWSTPGATPGGGTSPSAVQPTQTTSVAVTASTGQIGGPQGGSGTTSTGGAQQNWSSASDHIVGGGNPTAPAPASASNPAPVGTVAAGSDGPGASATIQNVAPGPVAPVMPVTNTTTVFGGSPGGVTGPNIQIAPGTMMAAPTTGLAGAPMGNNLFPASTNVPPVGNLSALAAPVPSSAVPPTSVPAPTPAAAPAAQPIAPHEQAGPPASAAQPLRIDASRGTAPATTGGSDAGVVTVATAIAALGLVGAAAQRFTGLWHDLGSTTLLRPAGTLLPTQFGRDDELLAAMPMGMETVYQKVLLPGEVDQLFSGQVETLRGLVYPYQAVRELRGPSELYDALGLGFVVSGIAGSDTLAFNRDAESVEVLRCAGLRQDDLVTPIDTDVKLPAGTVPPPLVRHHRRPWTGTGEAPGSTSENVIEEHEVLGYASVAIPHLAEIWRLHADGSEEYVSTYNARNGQWVGDTSPRQAQVGRRIDNGAYAGLSDGTVFRTAVLTDRESVLIAYGVSAPEHFEPVHDGSYRTTVSNIDIISVTGVATIGSWRSLPVQLLSRQGDMLLVDYAGDDPAAAAGFLQTNQGQWQPCSVEHTEVTDVQEVERAYALPRPAEAWHVAPQAPESSSNAPHDPLTAEVALGAAQ
jgi:hypothetical protein